MRIRVKLYLIDVASHSSLLKGKEVTTNVYPYFASTSGSFGTWTFSSR